jgi:lipoyl(octanoyl) transferase
MNACLKFEYLPALHDYQTLYDQMREFTASRNEATPDEIWFLEHHPVFTQGQAGKPEHVLNPGDIPIVQSDRGGQVTYHGPGQLMIYTLYDLKRAGIGIKQFVDHLQQSIILMLNDYGITARTKEGAPGVYVDEAKICSMGLRVRKGCTYHGMSLNVNMDLSPFSRINPCGCRQLKMTQIRDFVPDITLHDVAQKLAPHLSATLLSLETV